MKKDTLLKSIQTKLDFLFDKQKSEAILKGLEVLINEYDNKNFMKPVVMDEKRSYLITYGDSIYSNKASEAPLQTLKVFLDKYVSDVISDVHILPMFEYTSDDGFSVVDYMKMNPQLGSWTDVSNLGSSYNLMFDFVANHMSKQSTWFKKFLNQEAGYENSFVVKEKDFDTSKVTRPRTSPIFHSYEGKNGEVDVWTTFSEDQVDVNFKDPVTFVRICEILLEYCVRGASSIRLDAIGFIWKKNGTSCLSLKETHTIIEIHRLLIDYFCENTQLITETNVPHEENISYFGNGLNEAHQVYQFALPPLVLHTFTQNNSSRLSSWAKTIQAPSTSATYFNFLASHDGIGVRPVESILSMDERQVLFDKVENNGGRISYKTNPDGSKSAYELNINYSEALRNQGEDDAVTCQKMLAAHHILLSFVGVPAIYYHSLLGSKNDEDGVIQSGIARRINRKKLAIEDLENDLSGNEYRKTIFSGIKDLLTLRQNEKAFHPYGKQEILESPSSIFAMRRSYEGDVIDCYTNVSNSEVKLSSLKGYDVVSKQAIDGEYILKAYEFIWLKRTADE